MTDTTCGVKVPNINLDGSNLSFDQDAALTFDEISHTYHVAGAGALTPVSKVVEMFFPPFDAERISLRKCNGDALEAEKLREQWAAKGSTAAQAGTYLHKMIENYLRHHTAPESLQCPVGYIGKHITESRTVDISREWQQFLDFDRTTDYSPFRAEWQIYDLATKMTGTVDLLCKRADGTYEIFDWKRSSKVDPSEKNRWSSGINGLGHLTNTSYWHYCIQQNLYRYMLEKNYGLKVSQMHLVVLHPDYTTHRVVPVPRLDAEVATIVRHIS